MAERSCSFGSDPRGYLKRHGLSLQARESQILTLQEAVFVFQTVALMLLIQSHSDLGKNKHLQEDRKEQATGPLEQQKMKPKKDRPMPAMEEGTSN